MYSYLYSWVRLYNTFSSHFSILFGLNPESHSLIGSPFHRQHVRLSTCPPQICIWRSGDTNCPCRAPYSARAVVRPMLWQTSPDVYRMRPWLNCAALSAGGNHVKEKTSMDRVSRLSRGCCWCLRPSRSHSECELESWYRWTPRSLSTVPLSLLLSAASWLKSTSSLLTNIIFLNKLN